jgi:multiple antibiotic resistance protein
MFDVLHSTTLLFVLLNPFLLSIYLSNLIQDLDARTFRRVLTRASLISSSVFVATAWAGDAIFVDVLQARYAAFQIFGGLIFLGVGYKFAMEGAGSITLLRGDASHLSGAIAMPFMIGPGTVSASIYMGSRLPPLAFVPAIFGALALTTASLIVIKKVHDQVRHDYSGLVGRYWEVTGRVMAIVIGTLAIEMILQGIDAWLGTAH